MCRVVVEVFFVYVIVVITLIYYLSGGTHIHIYRYLHELSSTGPTCWKIKTSFHVTLARLKDLHSGVVIISVMLQVFPRLAERRFKVKWHPRFEHEYAHNWDVLAHMVKAIKLPTALFDREGLQVQPLI